MSTDRLTVSFCCNDHHGNSLDFVQAVEVDGLIQLEGPILFDDAIAGVEGTTPIHWTSIGLWLGGFWFFHHGRKRYAGSLTWDAVEMDKGEVARLLNHLAHCVGWSYLSAEVSLAQVWGEREITVADIERAMGS